MPNSSNDLRWLIIERCEPRLEIKVVDQKHLRASVISASMARLKLTSTACMAWSVRIDTDHRASMQCQDKLINGDILREQVQYQSGR